MPPVLLSGRMLKTTILNVLVVKLGSRLAVCAMSKWKCLVSCFLSSPEFDILGCLYNLGFVDSLRRAVQFMISHRVAIPYQLSTPYHTIPYRYTSIQCHTTPLCHTTKPYHSIPYAMIWCGSVSFKNSMPANKFPPLPSGSEHPTRGHFHKMSRILV